MKYPTVFSDKKYLQPAQTSDMEMNIEKCDMPLGMSNSEIPDNSIGVGFRKLLT